MAMWAHSSTGSVGPHTHSEAKHVCRLNIQKLPMRVVQQMHGRLPLIKDTQFQQLKNAPNMMSRLWAKVKGVPRGVYDFFTTKTQKSRVVLTDEYGNFTSTLPIFYTGSIQTQQDLQRLTYQAQCEHR